MVIREITFMRLCFTDDPSHMMSFGYAFCKDVSEKE